MATKRDQLQSHQFLIQRVVSALILRESDPEQPPFRRPLVAAYWSIGLALIVLAGFTVFGLIVPGGKTAWRDGESIIVEKETGTRFVYVDGRLHPAANYVSALLAKGSFAPLMNVSEKSLAGVPRGPRVGIADAPDSLPAAKGLLRGSWSLCSQPGKDQTGAAVDESVLLVGREPSGGRVMADEALLVAVGETGDQYLLRNGYRHRIRESDTVTVGLALRSEPWATVGMELVDGLPSGAPLRPIHVAKLGQPSKAVPGWGSLRNGQLLVVRTSDGVSQYYLAEADQLRPITPLQYDIQRAYAPTAKAYQGQQPVAKPLGLVAAGQSRQGPAPSTAPGQLPPERPEFVGPRMSGSSLCATFEPGGTVPRLAIDVGMPVRDEMMTTAARTGRGAPLADRVIVPPGGAALVEAMPSTQAPIGTVMLVSDLGIAYPLAGPEVQNTLGFDGVQPIRMPAGLVARIPRGSGLDPAAAAVQPAGPALR
ncbi:type VII secretion protein EccB [Kribbella sp. VKM Ac-2527]|uniref:Type VII secretion protein EccB n=1 Tax=Kribbella caucasensis TaxID=2512215 RepID=A0A4R6KHX3_9ACTN|nr:type VII secretion protein EccB [Kribbella sp. VKM Ac-2527]TDO50633.1 type VII secretion protein EccB [Kribbella sp. VKM Ac-2527]